MHSNIYQLIDDNDKYVREYIPEWWQDEGNCDYYDEMDDSSRENAIKWLAKTEKVDGESITIGTGYLEKRWEYFREKRNELSNMTKKQFMGKADNPFRVECLIHNIKQAFSDEFGFWFLLGSDMYTSADLERYCAGKTFKIGKVWDYHR